MVNVSTGANRRCVALYPYVVKDSEATPSFVLFICYY